MFIISLLVYVDINRMLNSNSNNFGFATMRGNKIISMENEKMLRHGSKRMMSSEQDKEWYYVKFNKCISMKEKREISSTINVKLDSFDMVTKSLYQLYLNQKQIDLLIEKNASIHRFEPEDKISISDVSQRKEYHKYLIIVHDTYTLPVQENLYQIIAKSSSTSYVVSVSVKRMKEAVKYLSKLSGVSLITDYVEATLNNHYASGFVQKNEQKFAENSEYMPRYLNDKGITGKNEIVTIIDDLIDFHHSHFYDEKVNVTFKTHLPSHRKIVYYNYPGTIAEFQQRLELDSHGTHVAGTVAGNNVCTDQKLKHYDGNAPDAKIAYASNTSNPELLKEAIKTMKITNSKISTNSWSTRENDPYQTFMVNQFSVKNPDKLFIFSSGNMGQECQISSVKDPSSSKNAITIGALSSIYSHNTQKQYLMQLHEDESPDPEKIQIRSIETPIKDFIGNLSVFKIADAESEKNICQFFFKDIDTILLYKNETESYNRYAECTNHEDFASRSVFMVNKTLITPFLNKNVIIRHIGDVHSSLYYSKAYYSSTGPTMKGILKPDVMTPGTRIVSAKALGNSLKDHGCSDNDYIFMDGTSMATPNAAGAAALIRQYFMDGKWLNEKISLNSIQLRGLMISSSSNMKMHDVYDDELIVNYRTGFGVIDLSTILSFNSQEFGVAMTKVEGNKIESQSHYQAKILVKKSQYSIQRLSFVLSYLDLETNHDSAIPLLNDLDLVVISPSGKRYLGNDNNYKNPDLKNKVASYLSTNERVLLSNEEIEEGEYTIDVYSNELFNEESIEFSLIVVGPVDNQYIEFKSTKSCDCYTSDRNSINVSNGSSTECSTDGHCKCDKNHLGNHCQIEISSIDNPPDNKFNITVGASEIKYFYLNAGKIGTIYVNKEHESSKFTSIWVSKDCQQYLSTFEQNNWIKKNGTSTNLGYDSPVCIALFNNYPIQQTFELTVSEEYINVKAVLIGFIVGIIVFITIIIVSIWLCCAFCECCANLDQKVCCGAFTCCHRRSGDYSSTHLSSQTYHMSIQT